MPTRPLLRSAAALLAACGGPEPLPGNPKGARYDRAVLAHGTVASTLPTEGRALIVELARPSDGAVVARRVVPGASFPFDFELRSGDLVPGGPPASGPLVARARLDADGDPTTAEPHRDPVASVPFVAGQPVFLPLAEPEPALAGPVRPVYANTKGSRYDLGLVTGTVAYGAPSGGRALILEVVSAEGALVERVAVADPSFPHDAALSAADAPPGARLRGWLDADGDPATRQAPEPAGEIPLTGASGFTLTLKDPP